MKVRNLDWTLWCWFVSSTGDLSWNIGDFLEIKFESVPIWKYRGYLLRQVNFSIPIWCCPVEGSDRNVVSIQICGFWQNLQFWQKYADFLDLAKVGCMRFRPSIKSGLFVFQMKDQKLLFDSVANFSIITNLISNWYIEYITLVIICNDLK